MASVLQISGATFDGSLLTCDDALGEPWTRGAMFDVGAGTRNFTLSLMPIRGKKLRGFAIGIARRDADIQNVIKLGGPSANHGYAVMCPSSAATLEKWVEINDSGKQIVGNLPQLAKFRQSIKIIYEATHVKQRLLVSIDDNAPVDVCFSSSLKKAASGYVPFVALYAGSFQVFVPARGHKRRYQENPLERMWATRQFADAEIVTLTGAIRVHRAVLAALPQFEVAFGGGYQESSACKVEITDVSHATVVALMQHIYLQDLPGDVNFYELLRLAHRYEQKQLIEISSNKLVDGVSEVNICEVARALRLFKEDPLVAPAWGRLVAKTGSPSMREQLLMNV